MYFCNIHFASPQTSGLSDWLGEKLAPLAQIPPFAISLLLSLLVATFTECSSNTATTTLFLPILASMVKGHTSVHVDTRLQMFTLQLKRVPVCLSGHSYSDTSAVRDAAVHHRCLSGLHVARGNAAQRHRVLIWTAQGHRHGEVDMHNSLI